MSSVEVQAHFSRGLHQTLAQNKRNLPDMVILVFLLAPHVYYLFSKETHSPIDSDPLAVAR